MLVSSTIWSTVFAAVRYLYPFSVREGKWRKVVCEEGNGDPRYPPLKFTVGYKVDASVFGRSKEELRELIFRECIDACKPEGVIGVLAGLTDSEGHVDIERCHVDIRMNDKELLCALADTLTAYVGTTRFECTEANAGRLYRVIVSGPHLLSHVELFMQDPVRRFKMSAIIARAQERLMERARARIRLLSRYMKYLWSIGGYCSTRKCTRILKSIVADAEASTEVEEDIGSPPPRLSRLPTYIPTLHLGLRVGESTGPRSNLTT